MWVSYNYYSELDVYNGEGEIIGKTEGLRNSDYYGLAIFGIVTYVFYGLVRNSLDNGLQPGYSLDIFCINLFSQFLLCFTRYGWYVYILVPGYIGYKIMGYIGSWVSSRQVADHSEQQEVDPKEAKRLAKKKEKEERPKVKYLKR